jgi:hypothetical protein
VSLISSVVPYFLSAATLKKVATSALDATEAIGGGGLAPFLRLLEGGEDGPLHQELRDYFTYTQLRMQVRGEGGAETVIFGCR